MRPKPIAALCWRSIAGSATPRPRPVPLRKRFPAAGVKLSQCRGRTIAHFESVKDYVSRDMISGILEDTEAHIDYLESELGLVEKVGLQNYLQTQIGEGPTES